MGGLARLSQLLRVADQDDVPGRARHSQNVGQRQLARLIDEQRVHAALELGPGPHPRGARDDVELTVLESLRQRRVVQASPRPDAVLAPTVRLLADARDGAAQLTGALGDFADQVVRWPRATGR